MTEVLFNHSDKKFIGLMSVYLAKMSLHHEEFCSKQSSLIGASSVYVALKICEQMRQQPILSKQIYNHLLQASGLPENQLIENSKKLLYLAQNFEKELPGLENLKASYIPVLNDFVQ